RHARPHRADPARIGGTRRLARDPTRFDRGGRFAELLDRADGRGGEGVGMLLEELAEGGVAAGAALAGAGRPADVAERPELERLNGVDDFGFGDLQATAD